MKEMATTTAEEDDAIHRDLSIWIVKNGGTVHPKLAMWTPPSQQEPTPSSSSSSSLDVKVTNDDDDDDGGRRGRRRVRYSRRGIFATHGSISQGEVLVRLPSHLALDGRAMSSGYHYRDDERPRPPPPPPPPLGKDEDRGVTSSYDDPTTLGKENTDIQTTTTWRTASPWLRCLASLVIAMVHDRRNRRRRKPRKSTCDDDDDAAASKDVNHESRSLTSWYGPYLASLPNSYDGLLCWSCREVRCFLAGTALSRATMASSSSRDDDDHHDDDHDDDDGAGGDPSSMMRERFHMTVMPYLASLMDEGCLPPPAPIRDDEEDDGYDDDGINVEDGDNPKRRRTEESTRSSANGTKETHGGLSSRYADRFYPMFLEGCQCISTRAFHMQQSTTSSSSSCNDPEETTYHGPYLLPYVDLLNHSPWGSPEIVTSLRRDADGSFVLLADRDIASGEEIRHSYDNSGTMATASTTDDDDDTARRTPSSGASPGGAALTSAQLLRTFGFVDVVGRSRILLDHFCQNNTTNADEIVVRVDDHRVVSPTVLENSTPAVLSRGEVCRSCTSLAESSYPRALRDFMDESGLSDEGWEHWEMPTSEESRSRMDLLASFSDEFVVPFAGALSDELISICCLHFLPQGAIDELLGESTDGSRSRNLLFGNEALEDHFLGKLVLRSIVNALDGKLNSYKVSSTDFLSGCSQDKQARQFIDFLGGLYHSGYESGKLIFCWGENAIRDAIALSKMKPVSSDLVQKFSYGMVISLEERSCLLKLKETVLGVLVQLDGDNRN